MQIFTHISTKRLINEAQWQQMKCWWAKIPQEHWKKKTKVLSGHMMLHQQWRSCCKTVHLFNYMNLRQRSTRRSLGLVRTFCYNSKHTIKIPRETVSVTACPCPVFCSVLVLPSGCENLLSWSQGRCKQFKISFACFFFTVCHAREQWFTAGRLQQTSLILLIL